MVNIPLFTRVLYLPGGAWFLNHQQYYLLEKCVDVTGWKIPTMNESMSVFFLVKKLVDFPCHVCFQRGYLEKSSHDLSWPISMVSFRPLSIGSWSRLKWLYHNSLKTNHICKVGDDPHPPTIFLNFTLPNFTHLKPPTCQSKKKNTPENSSLPGGWAPKTHLNQPHCFKCHVRF